MAEHIRGEEKEKTWGEYLQPKAGEYSCVVKPTIAATSFQIDPNFIALLQANISFQGRGDENPHAHIADFLEMCDTFRLDGFPDEVVRLKLFPLTLKGKAKVWWRSLPPNSLRSWKDVTGKFLMRYFSPNKTRKMRRLIWSFEQEPTESFYECWERFKELLGQCPQHGLTKREVVRCFFDGAYESIRDTLDAASGYSLFNRDPDEAYNLIENLAEDDYLRQPEQPQDWTAPKVPDLDWLIAKIEQIVAMYKGRKPM